MTDSERNQRTSPAIPTGYEDGQVNDEFRFQSFIDQIGDNRSRSSSINVANLPIRLALDLNSNSQFAPSRRASQLVIDQHGLSLKFAPGQTIQSVLDRSADDQRATQRAEWTTEGATVNDSQLPSGISLTFTQDGELSLRPEGSDQPLMQLKISPQLLCPPANRSRQNSLCSTTAITPPVQPFAPTLRHPLEQRALTSPLNAFSPDYQRCLNLLTQLEKSTGARDRLSSLHLHQLSSVPSPPSQTILTSISTQSTIPPLDGLLPNNNEQMLVKLKAKHEQQNGREERLSQVLGEMIFFFLLAGLGNVATGWLLFNVQTWPVFVNVPQLIILIPALLGLKGNVEMTLASRLSTHANLGDLDRSSDRHELISGNMALVQCQSSTVGFLAPLIALAISYISPDENDILTIHEAILLMASSVITANLANLLLSIVMFLVVFVCRKIDVNPDNVATPIAASLGDFMTMFLLSYTSRILFVNMDKPFIQSSLLIILLLLTPVWAYSARRSRYTRSIVFSGFAPICGAMMLQITGGLIMEHALSQFKKLAPLQPVVNGVGGNLVAIQCSRMATYLHRSSRLRVLPKSDPSWLVLPWHVFTSGKSPHSAMARLLLCLPIPSHLLFLMVIKLTRDSFLFTGSFLFVYSLTAWLQVACLLCLAYGLTHFLWARGINPDNSVIPFMTAFADLIGSAMLAIAFIVLSELKDENAFHQPPPHLGGHSLSVGHLLLSQASTSTSTTSTIISPFLSNRSMDSESTNQSSLLLEQLEPIVNTTMVSVFQSMPIINSTWNGLTEGQNLTDVVSYILSNQTISF